MKNSILGAVGILIGLTLSAGEGARSTDAPRHAAAPAVRFAAVQPIRDGARVEAAWAAADTMTRFTTVAQYDIATDQSEVQALFDEENLYLSAKGWYDAKAVRMTDELKRKNLFEFFIQADASKPRWLQVRVRENGETDAYEFVQGIKRKCERATGITVSAAELPAEKAGPNAGLVAWRANAVVPFKMLGLAAGEGARSTGECAHSDWNGRLGVMRTNVSLAGGRTEVSSLTAIIENFGLNEFWQPVAFTHAAGEPRSVAGDVRDARVNYFANPEFDIPGRCWQTIPVGGHVDHVETMAMSGEWLYRTTGKTYRFLCGAPHSFEPNTDYTLMVKARRYGDVGTLRILTMKRLPDGRPAEGEYLGGDISLGADFHEYYFPFRTDADQPTMINFYRIGAAAEDKGVEVAAIKLFRGRVSSLEIRPVSRIGMKVPIPGTALPMRPNPYGRRAEHLNALAFVRTMQDVREIQEVFAGLNVTLDILRTTAVDQDIYETDSDLAAVQKRLEDGAYGLFFVGERAMERIGAEMAKKVLASVADGAGLAFCSNRKMLHFQKQLDAAKLAPLAADHTLRKAFPYGMVQFEQGAPEGLRVGTIGKGRVVGDSAYQLRPRMKQLDEGTTDFPFADFVDPWVARVLYWTAGIDAAAGGGARSTGTTRRAAVSAAHNGKVITAARLVDAAGNTLDWEATVAEKTGPRVFVKAIADSVKGDTPFVFEVAASNAANLAVRWRLEDFSGRALETGTGTGRIEVSPRALYTNLGIFRAEIADGATVVDAARANCYARDRDIARTYDDFTASIWPMGGNVTPETIRAADKRLLDIGFRASLLPIGPKYANTLAGGLALGGGFLGGGDIFCGWAHKDNVRTKGELTTAKAYKVLAERAQYEARKTAKYGVTQCVVCDEPNFSPRFTENEPDEQPENIAEYRVRMERKYGTVEAYDKRHQTAWTDWSQVGPAHLKDARASGKYAEFLEWRGFNVDRWCEVIKHLADNGKKVDPDLKLALYNSFGQTAISGNDYWKLLTRAGLEFSNEYTAMVYFGRNAIYNFDEFYRSFRPDMRVWGFTGYMLSKEQISFMPWWFAAHRYGGFTWFATWSWLWNILDIPTCSMNGDSVALKKSLSDSRLLDGLGKYTLSWNWVPRDVALYYSHESLIVSTLLGTETKSFEIAEKGPLHEYMYSRQGLQYLVEDSLYQHDFISPEQVAGEGEKVKGEGEGVGEGKEGFLDQYKIVFMPRILALSDAEVAALRRFVAQGGTVVADVLPGDYDDLGVKRAANPFAPGEIKVWGRSFSDFDRAQHAEILAALKASGARPILASEGIENLDGREAMHLTDGIGDLYFVLRMTGRSTDKATETFVFPKKAHTWDVRTHAYLGETDRVTATIPASSAAVYAQLPFKPTGVRVDAAGEGARSTGECAAGEASVVRPPRPHTLDGLAGEGARSTGTPRRAAVSAAQIARGEDVTLRMALGVPPAAKDARFVFNVKLTKPDGSSSFLFERNLNAPGGVATLAFRIAANDPTGTWKATVTEPLTGLSAVCPFEVK